VYGRLLDQNRLLTATHAHEGDPFRSSSQWFIGLRDFRNVFDVDGRRGRGRSRANRDERAGAPPPASSAVADALFARFAAAIYGAYDAVVASARVASADGTVVGPAMEAAALAQDPAPQRIGRETIARMLEECKAMDVAMAGRERMI
jgi:hypothetical protein